VGSRRLGGRRRVVANQAQWDARQWQAGRKAGVCVVAGRQGVCGQGAGGGGKVCTVAGAGSGMCAVCAAWCVEWGGPPQSLVMRGTKGGNVVRQKVAKEVNS